MKITARMLIVSLLFTSLLCSNGCLRKIREITDRELVEASSIYEVLIEDNRAIVDEIWFGNEIEVGEIVSTSFEEKFDNKIGHVLILRYSQDENEHAYPIQTEYIFDQNNYISVLRMNKNDLFRKAELLRQPKSKEPKKGAEKRG